MSKYLIIGSGAQGGAAASIAARDNDIEKIIIGDINLALAEKVKKHIGSHKIEAMNLDASDREKIKQVAEKVDIVLNLTHLRFNENIMRACIQANTHYLDTAFMDPIWTMLQTEHPLKIGEEFKAAGISGLIGCGGAPGLINVMTRYICDKLEKIDRISLKVGHKDLSEKGKITTWQPTWSPEIALMDYALPPTVFTKGKYIKVPAFDGEEEYEFPPPVGKNLITHHNHEEPVTLGRYIGKGLEYVEFKYAVDLNAASAVKMGFASYDKIDINGTKVAPIDVLMKLVSQPVDSFLTETKESAEQEPTVAHPYLIDVSGETDGGKVNYKLWYPSSLVQNGQEKLEVFKKFGTTSVSVSLPALAGAKMILGGKAENGVYAPECLDPLDFLEMMGTIGWNPSFNVEISKEVSF
jgi:saccharopine dehydrogenase (NAD+, L-lysine-forming)